MISSDDEMTDSPPTTSFRRHDWSHDQLPYFGDRRDHKMTTSSPADTDQTVLSTTTSSDLSSSTTTGGDAGNISSHIHVSHILFLLESASIILKTLMVTFSKTVSLPQGLVMFDRIAILV